MPLEYFRENFALKAGGTAVRLSDVDDTWQVISVTKTHIKLGRLPLNLVDVSHEVH